MKKIIGVLVMLLVQYAVRAQFDRAPEFKRFGFRAGANFSHINFAKGVPPPAVPMETSWEPGLSFGFFMVVPITGIFYFQPEYLYAQTGGKIKTTNTAFKMNYISLPLFLKCQVHEKFALVAGPQFDLLINAKKTVDGSQTNITHDTEERSISATAGIEYQIMESLSVCARYMYGLNHIGIGQRSDLQEFKYEMAQITACIKF